MAIKGNQPSLLADVERELALEGYRLPFFEQQEKGHGRRERRRVQVSSGLSWMNDHPGWAGIRSVAQVERWRKEKGKQESYSKCFYISSLENPTPEQMAGYIRKHWEIENGLHWQLDVTFREDESRVRNTVGLQNLNVLYKWALWLLKAHPDKLSLKRKRKKAARDEQYLKEILKR